MKLLPEKLLAELLNIIADARQSNISNIVVFNALQELRSLEDAPKGKETPKGKP